MRRRRLGPRDHHSRRAWRAAMRPPRRPCSRRRQLALLSRLTLRRGGGAPAVAPTGGDAAPRRLSAWVLRARWDARIFVHPSDVVAVGRHRGAPRRHLAHSELGRTVRSATSRGRGASQGGRPSPRAPHRATAVSITVRAAAARSRPKAAGFGHATAEARGVRAAPAAMREVGDVRRLGPSDVGGAEGPPGAPKRPAGAERGARALGGDPRGAAHARRRARRIDAAHGARPAGARRGAPRGGGDGGVKSRRRLAKIGTRLRALHADFS